MKLSELMIRDIRAEVLIGDDVVIIHNPKGEIKEELLSFFNDQTEINMYNMAEENTIKQKLATNVDIVKLLMVKLTNIQVDTEELGEILKNPSYELNLILLYLSSIMQELILEVLATKNLEIRMEKNTLLEKDTLRMISDLEGLIKEVKHRKLVDSNEEI